LKPGHIKQHAYVARKRSFYRQRVSGDRMHQRQAPRVQRLTGEGSQDRGEFRIRDGNPARSRVNRVTNKREALRRQVGANLVRPPRAQPAPQQGETDRRRVHTGDALVVGMLAAPTFADAATFRRSSWSRARRRTMRPDGGFTRP
jgi:hypothetical protein